MARTTKERLHQMDASERKNRESIRAFMDGRQYRDGADAYDDRDRMLAHYERRLAELMARGAHRTHPWITGRYEADIMNMSGRRNAE